MSRQDANAAFALSSFLQGTNATYIDEIYARYEKDPSLGGCRVAGLLQEPQRPAG
ncbi:2-oxoglutarate dehydrogenase complex dehydrogenase (E1) component-like enzyme [Bradyrhizobium sp. LB7.1]